MPAPAPPQLPFTSGAAPRRSRRRRWQKRLLPPLALLFVAAWFAPAAVARTGLRNTLARKALADLHGSVEVGGASLGWFSPVELRDVTVKDADGRTIASVPRITSRRPLVALARYRGDPGAFTLHNPTLTVVCAKGETNVERAFAEYLKDGPAPGPARTPVTVNVTGGTLTLVDAATSATTSVEGVDATLAVPASRAEPVAVHLTAATGALNVEAAVGETGSAKLKSTGFPSDVLAPLLTRAGAPATVGGTLGADLQVAWGADAKGQRTFAAAGSVSGEGVVVGAPGLSGDRVRLGSVSLPLDVELTGRSLRVRRFGLTCDAGAVTVTGLFDPEHAADDVLTQPGVSVSARVEVAKLAAQLPRLLRLKPGTELREGQLHLTLASTADPADGGAVWEGTVNASALRGVRDGRAVAWEQPLHAEFVGRYTRGRFPTFKKFVCTSDVVALNAASQPDTLLVSANVYLGRLAARLRDFVDLDGLAIDGTAFASFAGTRAADGKFAAEVVVRLSDFALVNRDGRGLREPALEAKVNAAGVLPEAGPVRVATASAKLTADGDELLLTLVEPIADARKLNGGSADVHLKGRLDRWKARAGAAVELPVFALTGTVDARGTVRFAADRVTSDRLAVTLTDAKMDRWINLNEPTLGGVGDLTFDRAKRVATFSKLTITSATLKVADGTLAFELPEKGDVVVSGSGPSTVDLNRLGRTVRLYADPNGPDALSGVGVGPLRFRTTGDTTTFGGSLDVANFGYGPPKARVWEEPALRLEAEGKYDGAADAVALTSARAERPGLFVDAKGEVRKLDSTRDVSLSGTLRYDWEKLTPTVRQFIGPTFAATGTGSRGFALAGQLEPAGAPASPAGGTVTLKVPAAAAPGPLAGLNGDAAFGWQSVRAFGLDVGAVELDAKLARGVVKVERIHTTLAGGRASVEPTLDLGTSPGSATVTKGALIDHAKITSAALGEGGALRFALPAFAGALQADGEFSAAIEDNRFVLGDDKRTAASGVLLIHRATVGLTPVAAQVANLLGMKDTVMTLANETPVAVRVANGRVHHQNFAVRVSGTTFRTSGSVGFDHSLDLVVDVPLPKEFAPLKNNPVLQKSIAGKVLKVPLKGTLTKPELDPKGMNDALAALAREASKEAGKELLDAELRKLFPGMSDPKGGGLPIPLPFGRRP